MYNLYNSLYREVMSAEADINLSEAREKLPSLIRRTTETHQPVYLARRGHRVAALIDAHELARLLELAEDMEDILAAEAAREELRVTAETPIPWEDVRAELGLN